MMISLNKEEALPVFPGKLSANFLVRSFDIVVAHCVKKGTRRKAHWGLAHRKEAQGNLPIRLFAHEATCTLGYLHTRIVAHKPHAHQDFSTSETCTFRIKEK